MNQEMYSPRILLTSPTKLVNPRAILRRNHRHPPLRFPILLGLTAVLGTPLKVVNGFTRIAITKVGKIVLMTLRAIGTLLQAATLLLLMMIALRLQAAVMTLLEIPMVRLLLILMMLLGTLTLLCQNTGGHQSTSRPRMPSLSLAVPEPMARKLSSGLLRGAPRSIIRSQAPSHLPNQLPNPLLGTTSLRANAPSTF